MNRRTVLAVSAVLLIFGLLVAAVGVVLFVEKTVCEPGVFIGVDVGYGDENTVYTIADAVSGYANLIIIGSTNVTTNTTELTNVCNFLYEKGFYFIVYVGLGAVDALPPQGPDSSFFQMAINRWGEKFLGAYMFDEIGGKQFDIPPARPVPVASNYSDAALEYVTAVGSYVSLYRDTFYSVPQMRLFTSDYALYWYDYLSGYDVVFAELLGNESQSKQIAVALDRGAAESLSKQWGAIISFGTNLNQFPPAVPVLENASQLYSDMTMAFQSDAKYIVVLDSLGPNATVPTTPYGILTKDQLGAMKSFWNYAQDNCQPTQDPAQTAYVLPSDYGYGFRGPDGVIWGIFPADALAPKIWNDTSSLLTTYGMKLDIVYKTKTDDVPINLPYKTLIFWNNTILQQPGY